MNIKKILSLVTIIGILLSFTACNKSTTGIANTSKDITVKEERINDIPVLLFYKNDGNKKPVYFSLHGYGGSKSDHIEHCKKLAEKGYFAVTMDAYGHGERTGGDLLNFAQVVTQYPKDLETVVSYLKNEPQADLNNMAMAGVSMGAMASYSYSTYGEIKPKVLAPIIGTPDIAQLKDTELSRTTYDAKIGRNISSMPQTQINDILEKGSSYKDYENLKDIAIFMQNAGSDTLISIDGTNRLYTALREINAPKVELTIYPGLDHFATEIYWDNADKFIDKHILNKGVN